MISPVLLIIIVIWFHVRGVKGFLFAGYDFPDEIILTWIGNSILDMEWTLTIFLQTYNQRGHANLDWIYERRRVGWRISIHEVAKTSTIILCHNSTPRKISIHEVAKTSTTEYAMHALDVYISIHEVAKTSTSPPIIAITIDCNFNPRGRKDLDTGQLIKIWRERDFNPRGRKDLDVQNLHILLVIYHFNPRGRKDLDKVKRNEKKRAKNFNPRGRKDLDTNWGKHYFYLQYFNPRGRKDLDVILEPTTKAKPEFQSTRSQRPRHAFI